MPRTDLGDFEHLVLLAILRLGKDVALKRLEQKNLVTSRLGDSTPERGGRAKRFFKIKPSGLKALRESRAMFLSLWQDYESVLDRA
jgi:DNA-binding PadR family transcriptional regulator